jgi:hypothetical protein
MRLIIVDPTSMVVFGIFDRLKENVVIFFLYIWYSLKSISEALTVNSTFNIYIYM